MDAYFAGAVEMCPYSWVAVIGQCRLVRDASTSAGRRTLGGAGTGDCVCTSSVLPGLRAHLRVTRRGDGAVGAGTDRCMCIQPVLSEARAHLRVPVGARERPFGLARLSCVCRAQSSTGTASCVRIIPMQWGMSHYLPVPATATIRPCTLTLPSAGDRKSRRARNSPPPEVASPSCRQT